MSINRWEISNAQSSFASQCNFDNTCSYSLGTFENQLDMGGSFPPIQARNESKETLSMLQT